MYLCQICFPSSSIEERPAAQGIDTCLDAYSCVPTIYRCLGGEGLRVRSVSGLKGSSREIWSPLGEVVGVVISKSV